MMIGLPETSHKNYSILRIQLNITISNPAISQLNTHFVKLHNTLFY